jgi:hypothetical protein
MIVAMACVPQAPLLLPGLTGRPVPEVEKLQEAAASAVASLLDQGLDEVLVLAAAPRTTGYRADAPDPTNRLAPAPARRSDSHAPPTPVRRSDAHALPTPLAVGRSLLGSVPVPVSLHGIASDAPPERCENLGRRLAARPRRSGLLVAADGSARRGEKAPGYVDPRARDLDTNVAAALAAADVSHLRALDAKACRDLLVAGRAAWHVMAAACEGTRWLARVLYEDDPFGVAYWVLTWVDPVIAAAHEVGQVLSRAAAGGVGRPGA